MEEYEKYYQVNEEKIHNLLNQIDWGLISQTLDFTHVQDFTYAIYGAIARLYNGPCKIWQEIREFIKKERVLEKLGNYRESAKFYSFNRVLDDYNKLKYLNVKQTSNDYQMLKDVYILIVENIGILIKLGVIKETDN